MEDVQDTVETEEIQEEGTIEEVPEASQEASVPEVGSENYTRSIKRTMTKLRKRAQNAEKENAELRVQLKERIQRPTRPNPESFELGDRDPEFHKAMDAYDDSVYAWRETQKQSYEPVESLDERIVDYLERVEEAKLPEKYPDFYEVTENAKYHLELADELYDDIKGGELAYYLGKHQTELTRLNYWGNVDPEKMHDEVEKLKKRLFTKQASAAPKPMTPVNEDKGSPPKNLDEIKDNEEWYKAKQEERRRKLRGG